MMMNLRLKNARRGNQSESKLQYDLTWAEFDIMRHLRQKELSGSDDEAPSLTALREHMTRNFPGFSGKTREQFQIYFSNLLGNGFITTDANQSLFLSEKGRKFISPRMQNTL